MKVFVRNNATHVMMSVSNLMMSSFGVACDVSSKAHLKYFL